MVKNAELKTHHFCTLTQSLFSMWVTIFLNSSREANISWTSALGLARKPLSAGHWFIGT